MPIQLPVTVQDQGSKATGHCTPLEDKVPQKMSVPPRRVLPIIFLPGIMGSNLRMREPRQNTLKKTNNIAWKPDKKGEALDLLWVDPAYRQRILDPSTTEVDSYDEGTGRTGNRYEKTLQRHWIEHPELADHYQGESPLIMNDLITSQSMKTKQEKAAERGWQEVMFSSYRMLLEQVEINLNKVDAKAFWNQIVGHDPSEWKATPESNLKPISESELMAALAGTWFPVHAMGYNWLQSNAASGKKIASRVDQLIKKYKAMGYICEKVIIVTHSMGGLVARALIHPQMGNALDKVLGMIHGVMPSQGAPAAYRRMLCGFEEGLLGWAPAPKVLGNFGPEVTAVLGNSEGGLQLLPSQAYGNAWLEVCQGNQTLLRLPENNDPYDEIYKLRVEWFRLIREEWLNPANVTSSGLAQTFKYLDNAREFHQQISDTFHPICYAHYGADSSRPSWETVRWNIGKIQLKAGFEQYKIAKDNYQGSFEIVLPDSPQIVTVNLGKSTGAGDQTVPLRSSDHQRRIGRFKGIFLQSGYEHQASFQNRDALNSTLYCLVRIIQNMKWSGN